MLFILGCKLDFLLCPIRSVVIVTENGKKYIRVFYLALNLVREFSCLEMFLVHYNLETCIPEPLFKYGSGEPAGSAILTDKDLHPFALSAYLFRVLSLAFGSAPLTPTDSWRCSLNAPTFQTASSS